MEIADTINIITRNLIRVATFSQFQRRGTSNKACGHPGGGGGGGQGPGWGHCAKLSVTRLVSRWSGPVLCPAERGGSAVLRTFLLIMAARLKYTLTGCIQQSSVSWPANISWIMFDCTVDARLAGIQTRGRAPTQATQHKGWSTAAEIGWQGGWWKSGFIENRF